eukprot:TRINITY_DN4542_c0_g1_i14.p1 TRINITY_DN4542_c0_g1~~TRINITY_DN4542_c0_g1_i14.p1  ORF type:complete len:347 (-),score=28.50 TRINITY_DN4542_c0_g1_i14:127-1167(-)
MGREYEDSDLKIVKTQLNSLDPITKKQIVNPWKNKNCEHVYEKATIFSWIKSARSRGKDVKCPYAGCTERNLSIDHLVKTRVESMGRRSSQVQKPQQEKEDADKHYHKSDVNADSDCVIVKVVEGRRPAQNRDTKDTALQTAHHQQWPTSYAQRRWPQNRRYQSDWTAQQRAKNHRYPSYQRTERRANYGEGLNYGEGFWRGQQQAQNHRYPSYETAQPWANYGFGSWTGEQQAQNHSYANRREQQQARNLQRYQSLRNGQHQHRSWSWQQQAQYPQQQTYQPRQHWAQRRQQYTYQRGQQQAQDHWQYSAHTGKQRQVQNFYQPTFRTWQQQAQSRRQYNYQRGQ